MCIQSNSDMPNTTIAGDVSEDIVSWYQIVDVGGIEVAVWNIVIRK